MNGQQRTFRGLVLGACVVGVVLSGALAWAADLKIATIDVAKTFDGYQRTMESDKQLSDKGQRKEGEHTKMVDEIKKLREGIDLLSDKAKDERQKALEEKVRKLQEFEKTAREELQKERDGMARQILQEIDAALQEYAASNNYNLILNERVVVFGKKHYDITDPFVQWLNQRSKPKP